ncbi:MAG: hypothetical protein V5A84_01460 [Planctomycetota bacterium]
MATEKNEQTIRAGHLVKQVVADVRRIGDNASGIGSPSEMQNLALPNTAAAVRDALGGMRDVMEEARRKRAAGLQERARLLRRAAQVRRQRVEMAPEARKAELERAEEDKFVLTGRIMDEETGRGLPDVRLRVFDMDRKYDDLVAETTTDELGYYRVVYDQDDFKDIDEKPEMFIEALDEEDEVFYTSPRGFRHKSGRLEVLNAAIGADRVPSSRERSKKISDLMTDRKKELRARSRNLRDVMRLKGYR